MDLDEPEAEDAPPFVHVHVHGHGCLPPHHCPPCFHSPDSSPSHDRGEEEIMMSHALEGLPEWRSSPSRSGDDEWGRRSDVPSHHRSQDEQDQQDQQDLADAISKRTRAHYSLADMSLDQLETFLQESDEEDYFQNVDDEEEYRKFLAAVQEKVGAQEDNTMEKVIEESESEDEDADFEVEIEEALESDIDEGLDGIGRKGKRTRRPVTREKRRKRESLLNKVVRAGRAKALLRPLLPYSGNGSVERSRFLIGSASRPWKCSAKKQPSYCGFTSHQIGQLYCLMHEHVQLLLQVYAMCVLEPAMQQMAVDTHRMLMELVEKREAVLSSKTSVFPDFCFRPPCIHPSVREDEISSFQDLLSETPEVVKSRDGASSPRLSCSSGSHRPGVSTETIVPLDSNSAPIANVQPFALYQLCSPYINRTQATSSSPHPQVLPQSLRSHSCEVVGSPIQVNKAGSASTLRMRSPSGQTKSMDNVCGSELLLSSSSVFSEFLPLEWVPATSGSVRSLLDVAPLALVREFTEVVDRIVQASKQQDFSIGIPTPEHSRAPLFAVRLQLRQIPKSACEWSKAHSSINMKRTMAAVLVESTKKQTIALVPKDIAAAMERFRPLFNKSLLPHRAPPAAAANRLLFTDAEDELLAMGLMTYNNDWKAIQERFLPSKSMHQIFVRQKNRSSARAPLNSIKAVKRMKSSPLTVDEIAGIEEALKVYKYDWTKVWQFCVPHRDPATLPRQWRAALGTQKSYKPNVNKKEKRKLHDARRQQDFATTSQICPSVGTVHSELYKASSRGDCGLENSEFHKEILGDLFTSPTTSHLSSEIPLAVHPIRSSDATSSRGGQLNGKRQSDTPYSCSGTLGTHLKFSKRVNPEVCCSPSTYTSLLKDNQTVQLAPGLPSLKLPPTVRVLSHSDTALLKIPSLHSSDIKVDSDCSTNKSFLGRLAGHSKQS